ncbi:uncharacterized protein [Physcomitrium patens]|uniref:uncharacterized protein isoform X3 n=1 Tax=Physcomitrium patens TaxID=3218 RepID=UPI003CCCE7D4
MQTVPVLNLEPRGSCEDKHHGVIQWVGRSHPLATRVVQKLGFNRLRHFSTRILTASCMVDILNHLVHGEVAGFSNHVAKYSVS